MIKRDSEKKKRVFEISFSNTILAFGIVICTALSIVSSILVGKFIDFIENKPNFDQDTFLYLFSILGAMILTTVASIYLAQYFPLRLQLKKSIDYSQKVMNGLLKISQKNYQSKEKGYYINLVTSSAFTCGDIYGQINVELVGNAMCVLLLIIIATYISPYLGGIYLLYIPIFALLTQKPNKKIAAFQKVGLPTQDSFLSGTKKIVEDKRSINIARAESYYSNSYKKRSEKYLSFVTKFKWYSILATNIPTMLSAMLTVATMGIAAKLYFDEIVTLGTIFVIFQLSQLLQSPLNRCFEILIYRSINDVHIERIQDFDDLQQEKSGFEKVYSNQEKLALVRNGKLFSTAEKRKMLFSVEDLAIPKNSLVLIKGKNGTGKSTLTNYLTGFVDIDVFDGTVKLDNSLSNAAYLSYPILFAEGNIEENMFGVEIDQEVYEMLGASFEGKNINESGNNLSLGEQQKLGLLRVLSSKAAVVVLDEPFTNLDKDTIYSLTAYIAKIKGKKSIIVITHSPELDPFADMILRIDSGSLVRIDQQVIC